MGGTRFGPRGSAIGGLFHTGLCVKNHIGRSFWWGRSDALRAELLWAGGPTLHLALLSWPTRVRRACGALAQIAAHHGEILTRPTVRNDHRLLTCQVVFSNVQISSLTLLAPNCSQATSSFTFAMDHREVLSRVVSLYTDMPQPVLQCYSTTATKEGIRRGILGRHKQGDLSVCCPFVFPSAPTLGHQIPHVSAFFWLDLSQWANDDELVLLHSLSCRGWVGPAIRRLVGCTKILVLYAGAGSATSPNAQAGDVREGFHGVRRRRAGQLGYPCRFRLFRARCLGLRFHSPVSMARL